MVQDRLHFSAKNCSLARTLEIVGERWTMLVIREALLGVSRFDDLRMTIGCARNVLAARLVRLVEAGVLERVPYREPGMRERFEYRLTEKGRELSTAVVALMRWGDRHLADAAGPPLEVVHAICGEKMRARLSCERHGLVPPSSVAVRIGPGARRISGPATAGSAGDAALEAALSKSRPESSRARPNKIPLVARTNDAPSGRAPVSARATPPMATSAKTNEPRPAPPRDASPSAKKRGSAL